MGRVGDDKTQNKICKCGRLSFREQTYQRLQGIDSKSHTGTEKNYDLKHSRDVGIGNQSGEISHGARKRNEKGSTESKIGIQNGLHRTTVRRGETGSCLGQSKKKKGMRNGKKMELGYRKTRTDKKTYPRCWAVKE